MRFHLFALALLALTLPAAADWKVAQDGTAIMENGGNASLALRCDKNSNTGNQQSWRLELAALDLQSLGPQTELEFKFPGRYPMHLMAEHRLGKIYIDGMERSNQSDLTTLVSRLKAARSVTIKLTDASSGARSLDPVTFDLTGSSRTISQIASACK
jgi:hypothetical protein